MTSAGLLMYRRPGAGLELLLAHPGGPFWARRDEGAWTIPKGELLPREEPFAAALREFEEETGQVPTGPFLDLGEIRQKGGKRVLAWAFQGDFDPAQLRCNLFEMEWPPRSGRRQQFPEIDRAEWFSAEQALPRLLAAQHPFLVRLQSLLAASQATAGQQHS
jgi:predicted NUDIX family NTP pyrophosphohydrolase